MKQSHRSVSVTMRLLVCAALSLLLSTTSFAHTALSASTPGDGGVVKAAPGHINLTFNGPVRLIKLELMGVGHEMPTNFAANSEAKAEYMIETPGMHPGKFTVNWAVIGADGHTVASSYTFTVDPSATDAQVQASAGGSAGGDH